MVGIQRLAALLAVAIAVIFAFGVAFGQDSALIRFVHLDADSPPLDVYVNDALAAAGLHFGDASSFVSVPAGAARISTFFATTSVQVYSDYESLATGHAAIVIAPGANGRLHTIPEDLSPIEFGRARLSLFSALDADTQVLVGAPGADAAHRARIASFSAGAAIELDAGAYDISMETGATMEPQTARLPLSAAMANLAIIHGSPEDPQILNAAASIEGAASSGRLRFVHAIAGAAPVDIRINDALIVPSLTFAMPTAHIALPSGTHDLAVSIGPVDIIQDELQIRADEMMTIVLMRSNSGLGMDTFADAIGDLSETSAVVTAINAIPNSVISHLQMQNGAIVALNVPYGQAGYAAQIVPGRQSLTIHLDIGEDRGEIDVPAHYFAGGAYYNLIALAGGPFAAPRLLIAETAIQRQIEAPLVPAAVEEAATPAEDIEQQPVELAQAEPTAEAEAEAEAAATKVEAQVEAVETQTPEATAVPTDDPETDAVATEIARALRVATTHFATVNVDADAALHLRQYPSSQAMSLGLLPAQSQLFVLGRRGATQIDPGETIALPVDLSDFRDEAVTLLPYQDLPPATTWLYVMYRTPDGGALYGWANALYLNVVNQAGDQQRLASLALVRQNEPGSAFNTSIRPPELRDRIAARVIGLDSGAMLNLRSGNDSLSEILAHLPPETMLRVIGVDADDAWAFVEYQTGSDSAITGWASMDYVQLLLNGAPVQAATLRALDPSALPVIGAAVTGGTKPFSTEDAAPPMDGIIGEVNVNFDSALHLRRYPDATSESLALIPPDTALRLDGITETGDWYKVSYDGEDGWVAAAYLILSMDGRLYAREFLENQLPRFSDLGF